MLYFNFLTFIIAHILRTVFAHASFNPVSPHCIHKSFSCLSCCYLRLPFSMYGLVL